MVKARPSAWYCGACRGPMKCPEDHWCVTMASPGPTALWMHEWAAVAWMAAACDILGVRGTPRAEAMAWVGNCSSMTNRELHDAACEWRDYKYKEADFQ